MCDALDDAIRRAMDLIDGADDVAWFTTAASRVSSSDQRCEKSLRRTSSSGTTSGPKVSCQVWFLERSSKRRQRCRIAVR